ncbi:MAG: glycogen/starch synthase [Bacteroides sp.]|nr:glycogen/starch synthase [Bacteroides sp.]
MEKPKILFVSQEIYPYTRMTQMSKMGRYLPQGIQEQGNEIRTFMPRYGVINERRNQLHEVIRLSGINLIINDTDHPLVIKVASIQAARMQIYFIDNEEFFYKKNMFADNGGKLYPDNDEKVIFFARGVLETVKKLSWAPDIIHCSGWFTSLLPFYVRKFYQDSPVFANAKIITALYNDGFEGTFPESFGDKLLFDNFAEKDIKKYGRFSCEELTKMAIDYSDGLMFADKDVANQAWLKSMVKASKKPVLNFPGEEGYVEKVNAFYGKFLQTNK